MKKIRSIAFNFIEAWASESRPDTTLWEVQHQGKCRRGRSELRENPGGARVPWRAEKKEREEEAAEKAKEALLPSAAESRARLKREAERKGELIDLASGTESAPGAAEA